MLQQRDEASMMKKCENWNCSNTFRVKNNDEEGQIYCSEDCYKFCECDS